MIGDLVARVLVLVQQVANLHLHQLDQLGVLHRVALVQEHHDAGHAHLARQQHVLLGLRHRPVGRRDHQNRPVHLRRAGDHVLDVVGVARAVHMRVVPVLGLVLHMRRGDRDAALALFRRVVDRVERAKRVLRVVLGQHLRDRRRQRRLAVIDVPNRPYVYMRLRPVKLFLAHDSLSVLFYFVVCPSCAPVMQASASPFLVYLSLSSLPCTFAMTSSDTDRGASSYCLNCIE